ncbi:hypothetical protein CspeluHIS016_0801720 [Cutaneotrichosporon spelunceum]|uniref:RRM domain-containing protein n=1 Tax=Cutaneotrichosporon spelunceum TaxID=1672016 RepID=A0AAD3TZR5_9TREE|nr:hypothetical protein CspeluHIS016_0801720 [Cutaneotrichosporon spelunceum]
MELPPSSLATLQLSPGESPQQTSPSLSLAGSSPTPSSPLLQEDSPIEKKMVQSPSGIMLVANLDPRSLSFQPTGDTHTSIAVLGTQHQVSNSAIEPAQGLSPSSNSVLTTPASQRTYSPTTPSSVAWSSSPNTQYSWDGSGRLKTSGPAKRLSEPDVLGLDGRLNRVLGNNNLLFEPLTEETASHWLLLIDVPRTAELGQLRQLVDNLGETKAIVARHLLARGWVVVAFWDSRQAHKVYKELSRRAVRFSFNMEAQQLHCVCIGKAEVRDLTGDGPEWSYLWDESEPIVHIQVRSLLGVEAEGFKVRYQHDSGLTSQAQLNSYGDLKSFKAHDNTGHAFTAEFYDSRVAADIIRTYNNLPITGGTFVVSYLCDDPFITESSRHPTSNFPDHNTRSAFTRSASPSTFSQSRASVTTTTPTSMAFPKRQDAAFSHAASSLGLSSFLDDSLSSSDDLSRRFDSVFRPFDTESSSFRRSQSGILRRGSQLNLNSEPANQWASPANDELCITTRTNRPPNVRRLTDSATLQTMLNGMNETAQSLQRQNNIGGSNSAPLSPTSLNPRVYSGWPQSDSKAVPMENKVFLERIAAGLDNRTTVMVKDVPNKLSRQELVDILNQVVPGHFDFVYLRFDFHNHCNVGYAFVNFTSTGALLEFYRARVGKRWNLFSSEKVLQVGYANIQGKVALVNKFRNSAVMDVQEQWRPQIFYSDGALRGQPEPFPESDSVSRGQRAAPSARLSFLAGSPSDMIDYDYTTRLHDYI